MASEMQRRIKAQRAAEARAWNDWQANPVPVGTPVEVTKDDRSVVMTATRSVAWKLGDGTPVVMVDGISGGYLLTRLRVLPRERPAMPPQEPLPRLPPDL